MKKFCVLFVLCVLIGCDNTVDTKFESTYDYEVPGYIPSMVNSIKIKKIACDHIVLEWKDCMNETGYKVTRELTTFAEHHFNKVFKLNSNTVELVDSVEVGQYDTFYYLIASYNENGTRGFSQLLEGIDFPEIYGLKYEHLANNNVRFSWNQNQLYENTGYGIYVLNKNQECIYDKKVSADTREFIISDNVFSFYIYAIYGSHCTDGIAYYTEN